MAARIDELTNEEEIYKIREEMRNEINLIKRQREIDKERYTEKKTI